MSKQPTRKAKARPPKGTVVLSRARPAPRRPDWWGVIERIVKLLAIIAGAVAELLKALGGLH